MKASMTSTSIQHPDIAARPTSCSMLKAVVPLMSELFQQFVGGRYDLYERTFVHVCLCVFKKSYRLQKLGMSSALLLRPGPIPISHNARCQVHVAASSGQLERAEQSTKRGQKGDTAEGETRRGAASTAGDASPGYVMVSSDSDRWSLQCHGLRNLDILPFLAVVGQFLCCWAGRRGEVV
ncbi:unnamed protein product [Polarella glacialis]|uniref:Uncharacterized protein n=1 Tax=Polarella glacialis TaxID=89957 RepID=A0A813GBB5_POLGL|nr:unnamed protein product [Polarella glacialis]